VRLSIGGITPLTSIDFPGRLAAVVFCRGCAWRCPYCHNPHLLSTGEAGSDWETLNAFLRQRLGLLDGIVFSGGEPLLQSGLLEAIQRVRAMGYKVALHTAGAYPDRLKNSLPYLDWVGLDVKASFDRYAEVTGITRSGTKVKESLKLLLESGVDYEVRTTANPDFFSKQSVLELAKQLAAYGVSHYVLQECRPVGETHPSGYREQPAFFNDHAMLQRLKGMFASFTVRHA
jgi:pyruvate formate lyase activating enzyme